MKIKYFIVGILLSLVFPAITNAASLSLESVSSTEKNIVKYNIVYDPTDATETSIKIEVNKANDGLIYQFGSIKEGIIGDCNNQNLSCTINVQELTEKTTLTELKITNNTENDIDVIPSIMGTYQVTLEAVTIKALPQTTTTTTTTTTRALSSDSTLSNITITSGTTTIGTFDQPFNKDIKEYNITEIKDTFKSIYITPTCEYCEWQITCPTGDCEVSNKKKVTLNKTGVHQVAIVVSSEDKTASQTYILNIYKGEIEASSAYLSNISIENIDLSPKFDSLTNDYSANLTTDLTELNITATPDDPKAEVEIKGNKDLKEGENTITITVTSSDEKNKQVYTIIVNKELVIEEPEEQKTTTVAPTIKDVPKKNNDTLLIVVISLVALAIIVIVGILLFKKKKNNNKKDDNDKNDKGNKITKETTTKKIIEENTESLNILNETKKELYEEPKQDIDEALDDLMMTKRLELGELDF
ncbi:MAG: cadherin-like beta sandwich domain-containing protein [Bacilli bacterium]|nr:cadherin-like beta sandwich domain-containing protein [Bacilli bacterium]